MTKKYAAGNRALPTLELSTFFYLSLTVLKRLLRYKASQRRGRFVREQKNIKKKGHWIF